jgi:hypothetical protein
MQSLGNSWHLGHIALTIPDACVVHAVRHPADTSLSSFQQSFGPSAIPWSFNLAREFGPCGCQHARASSSSCCAGPAGELGSR